MAEQETRKVGTVTGVTTVGGGLGAALAQIAVEFIPRLEAVESAVTVVLTVALALVAGWAVPPQGGDSEYYGEDDLEDLEDLEDGLEVADNENALH